MSTTTVCSWLGSSSAVSQWCCDTERHRVRQEQQSCIIQQQPVKKMMNSKQSHSVGLRESDSWPRALVCFFFYIFFTFFILQVKTFLCIIQEAECDPSVHIVAWSTTEYRWEAICGMGKKERKLSRKRTEMEREMNEARRVGGRVTWTERKLKKQMDSSGGGKRSVAFKWQLMLGFIACFSADWKINISKKKKHFTR